MSSFSLPHSSRVRWFCCDDVVAWYSAVSCSPCGVPRADTRSWLASRHTEPLKPLVSSRVFPSGDTTISIIFTGDSNLNGQLDRAIGQLLLDDRVTTAASFQSRFLDGIHLNQAI